MGPKKFRREAKLPKILIFEVAGNVAAPKWQPGLLVVKVGQVALNDNGLG